MHVHNLVFEAALGVENLDAVVLAVGDVHVAVLVSHDVVGEVELAGVGAWGTPGEEVLTIGVVLVDGGVAVAVGDVDIAGSGVEGNVGALVEGLAAVEWRCFAWGAYGEEHHPVEGGLSDGVVAVVYTEQGVAFEADGEAVGVLEQALSPG